MKELKVRVKHYAKDYYTIQYSYKSFLGIRLWSTLMRWIDSGVTNDLADWNPVLHKIDSVEKVASKFKTVKDIENHYHSEKHKEERWIVGRSQYLNKTHPYQTKTIK